MQNDGSKVLQLIYLLTVATAPDPAISRRSYHVFESSQDSDFFFYLSRASETMAKHYYNLERRSQDGITRLLQFTTFYGKRTNIYLLLFQFVSEEMHRGMPCLKYERINRRYNRTNTYSFFISKTKPHKPLRYEMMGYDDMLTSHYDHYVLDYISFEPWQFNRSLFGLPKSK